MVIIWVSSNVYYIHLAFGVEIIVLQTEDCRMGKYLSIPGMCLPLGGQSDPTCYVRHFKDHRRSRRETLPSGPQALCMRQAPRQIGLDDRNSGSVDSLLRLRTNPRCRASWKSVSVQKVFLFRNPWFLWWFCQVVEIMITWWCSNTYNNVRNLMP